MGALDEFLQQVPEPFDIATLLDPDVTKFGGADYTAPLIYKYLPVARRGFFERPQVRFSQREALNDPFEMTRRWKEVTTDRLQRYLRERLSTIMPQIFANPSLLAARAKDHFETEGVSLSPSQVQQMEDLLKSDAGKSFLANQLVAAEAFTGSAIDYVFSRLESEFDRMVFDYIAKVGVLSLSEDPLNQLMWAHYASAGTGFVVGFDAHHMFFHAKSDATKHVLRKVWYTDERTENFWRNPYFLFLVKNSNWAYEREWRMIKELTECDDHTVVGGQDVHLCNVPLDAIKAVHFGYAYDAVHLQRDIAALTKIGGAPAFQLVQVNQDAGSLQSNPIGNAIEGAYAKY